MSEETEIEQIPQQRQGIMRDSHRPWTSRRIDSSEIIAAVAAAAAYRSRNVDLRSDQNDHEENVRLIEPAPTPPPTPTCGVKTVHFNLEPQQQPSQEEDSSDDDSVPRDRVREQNDHMSATFLYYLIACMLALPALKVVVTMTVLLVDLEKDNQCRLKKCTHLVYTKDTAVYFMTSLILLILSVSHFFIGMEIFIRHPDIKCTINVYNINVKAMHRPVRYFGVVTAIEILVVTVAGIASESSLPLVIPGSICIFIETVAFISVFCHANRPSRRRRKQALRMRRMDRQRRRRQENSDMQEQSTTSMATDPETGPNESDPIRDQPQDDNESPA